MENMYVGITDTTWMNFIKENIERIGEQINFWTPGTTNFKILEPGEMFLFKLHAKKAKGENGEIVGGAYFAGYKTMTVVEAWEKYGYGNGANSVFEMEASIKGYRERNNMGDDAEIGCIILENAFFFDERQWIPSPEDWKNGIVRGKKYSTSDNVGFQLYQEVTKRIDCNSRSVVEEDMIEELEREIDLFQADGKTKEALVKVRVNQGVFREKLLRKYNSCCLCKVSNPSFLIASHIKPWASANGKEKLDVDNGFLMCPNHDALFDAGYISFDDDGQIIVSEKLGELDAMFMNINSGMRIELTEGNKKYLRHHRIYVLK